MKKFWSFLILTVALFYAFYTGFRGPCLWSSNYYQLSYFDGFIRRGFLGTLLYPLQCQRFDYFIIQKIQLAVLAIVTSFFIWAGFRRKSITLLIIYFITPVGAFLMHEVGYSEQVLWILLGVSLILLHYKYVWISALLMSVAILVHDIALFLVLPVVFVKELLQNRKDITHLSKLFVLPLMAFVVTYIFQRVSPETVDAYIKLASQCGHELKRLDYFHFYQESFFGRHFHPKFTLKQTLTGVIPMTVLSLYLGYLLRKIKNLSVLITSLSVALILLPLTLSIFGWDLFRWHFLSYTQLIIVCMITNLITEETKTKTSIRIFYLSLLVVGFLIPLDYFDPDTPRVLNWENIRSFGDYFMNELSSLPE